MEVLGYSALNRVEIHNRIMLNFYLGLPHILSVICFIFVVKIFLYTEIMYENILHEYNFKYFRRWLAPCYIPALPELLLPLYPCICGSF